MELTLKQIKQKQDIAKAEIESILNKLHKDTDVWAEGIIIYQNDINHQKQYIQLKFENPF